MAELSRTILIGRAVGHLPPPWGIPDWRRFPQHHSNPSQIGADFSDFIQFGVALSDISTTGRRVQRANGEKAVSPLHSPPGGRGLVANKRLVPFDRPVTER